MFCHDFRLHLLSGLQRFRRYISSARLRPLLHGSPFASLLAYVVLVCVTRAIGLRGPNPASTYVFAGTRFTWLVQYRGIRNLLFRTDSVTRRCRRFRLAHLPWSSFPSHCDASCLHMLQKLCFRLTQPSLIASSCPNKNRRLVTPVGPVYRVPRRDKYFWQADFPPLQAVCSASPFSRILQRNLTVGTSHHCSRDSICGFNESSGF